MRIVVGNYNFIRPAGTEMYLLTVGERLTRLGHEVVVFSVALGDLADEAARRGIRVTDQPRALPEECDVVLTQDGPTAYTLAERYPAVAQIFVATTDVFDLGRPPRLPGIVRAVVALSDRTADHLRAFSLGVEVTRLTLPVDLDRFAPRSAIAERPRRALLIGNYLHGHRRDLLTGAWAGAGLELDVVGRHGDRFETDVPAAMARADVVVGRATVILEAMACGRAAYVYDGFGTDGWLTPETYPALEADNFHGLASDRVPDPARLRQDLEAYRPEMGLVNRDLVERHHGVEKHVQRLVALFEAVRGTAETRPPAPLEEMAWLARQNWLTESRAFDAVLDANRAREELGRSHTECAALADRLRAEVARSAAAREQAEQAEQARVAVVAEREHLAEVAAEVDRQRRAVEAFRASRRHRLASAMATPFEVARRLRRR